jgi:hypothetical protein
MKELILLDSDSTDTVFCNPKYVMNIRDSNKPLSISTNGGELKSYKKCDIPHIDNVWFNKNSITNIISMKDITDKFRVTMILWFCADACALTYCKSLHGTELCTFMRWNSVRGNVKALQMCPRARSRIQGNCTLKWKNPDKSQ